MCDLHQPLVLQMVVSDRFQAMFMFRLIFIFSDISRPFSVCLYYLFDYLHNEPIFCFPIFNYFYMSRVMRKPTFCICENKDADQLRGNREADQRLCFRYTDNTIPLLSKSEISSL